MLVPVVSTPSVRASRATGIKRRKLGGFGHSALKCTLSRSSIWELRGDLSGWNEESPGLHLSWVVPLASTKNAPDRSAQDCETSGNVQKTAQIVPESARETGLHVRGCASTARWVARDPAARKAAQVKVRSKFYGKNVETTKSSKLALAEELATLGGCEPIYPLSEVTLLTVAGALDSAGYRSASSYIAELRLRHVELDFATSPALDRAFKKVNDPVTKGPGPVKKAPEVKLLIIKHDTDTLIVGSADAYVISLHWLLREDETEGLSLGMTSLKGCRAQEMLRSGYRRLKRTRNGTGLQGG